jgi:hypothetical protein
MLSRAKGRQSQRKINSKQDVKSHRVHVSLYVNIKTRGAVNSKSAPLTFTFFVSFHVMRTRESKSP